MDKIGKIRIIKNMYILKFQNNMLQSCFISYQDDNFVRSTS